MLLRISAACMLLLLAACGFEPAYGTKSAASQDSIVRAGISVSVNNASGNPRLSQLFKNHLDDLIQPAAAPGKPPVYAIQVTLSESLGGIGVSRDGTASRYNLIIDSSYTITRAGEATPLTGGSIRNVTSYNNPNNQYFSIYISEQDARTRGLRELAETYRQRLINYTEKTLVPVAPINTSPPIPLSPLINEDRTKIY